MIHFDTSFLVDLLREQARGADGPATRWLESHAGSPVAVSVFVWCELEAGAAAAAHPQRERDKIRALLAAVPVVEPSDAFAALYGATLVEVQRRAKSISTMDLLIAVTALDAGAAILTGNRRHFEVVPDLTVLTHR